MCTKKDRQQTLFRVQIRTNTYQVDQIVQDPGRAFRPDRAFVREELMHVSKDNQVPRDWVSEWNNDRIIFL